MLSRFPDEMLNCLKEEAEDETNSAVAKQIWRLHISVIDTSATFPDPS